MSCDDELRKDMKAALPLLLVGFGLFLLFSGTIVLDQHQSRGRLDVIEKRLARCLQRLDAIESRLDSLPGTTEKE
jgi:hypothetical protein